MVLVYPAARIVLGSLAAGLSAIARPAASYWAALGGGWGVAVREAALALISNRASQHRLAATRHPRDRAAIAACTVKTTGSGVGSRDAAIASIVRRRPTGSKALAGQVSSGGRMTWRNG